MMDLPRPFRCAGGNKGLRRRGKRLRVARGWRAFGEGVGLVASLFAVFVVVIVVDLLWQFLFSIVKLVSDHVPFNGGGLLQSAFWRPVRKI
jgi:hypothetical protein